jgi:ABC-type nitrate/sulfonate/bicarbonate transport system permease component
MNRSWRTLLSSLTLIWLPVVLILAWWIGSATSTSVFFPPLSKILERLREQWLFDHTVSDLLPSLTNLAVGYFLAAVVGVFVGAMLWRFRGMSDAAHPVVYFLYVLPAPALLPLFMALFGLGATMKISIIFLSCVWPVLLNTLDGMRSTDSIKIDVARVLNLNTWATLRRVVLPAAAPQIAAGLRTSLAIGIVLMVVSEMTAATSGIGYFILNAQQTFATVDMWTGILVLAIVGSLLNLLFIRLERWVLRWHYQARAISDAH